MSIRSLVRRCAVVVPLVVTASVLPVAQPAVAPEARQWAITIDGTSPIRAPEAFSLLGVSWPSTSSDPATVAARTSADGERWTSWQPLEVEPDVAPDTGTEGGSLRATMPLWTGRAAYAQVSFEGPAPAGAQVRFVDPGPDPALPASTAMASPT